MFFRERKPVWSSPVVPGQSRREDRSNKDGLGRDQSAPTESSESANNRDSRGAAKSAPAYPLPDDESAATGIGRSVGNSVQWIKMDLDSRPAGEVTIRYEYRAALVRLGILPREYPPRPDVLGRRERAEGFEPRYCPQP